MRPFLSFLPYLPFLPFLPLAVACKKAESPAQQAADTAMTVRDSFKTPESVLYDAAADIYLVTNINGAPTAKDDNGFISKVAPDGHVIALKFIDGATDSVTLNAPKGMGIHGDTLFVADIDAIRMFDRATGRALGAMEVRGATFLNDVDVGRDGTLWFTDSGLKADFSASGTDAIYLRGTSGPPRRVAHGTDLGQPNGILADSSGATVVTNGSGEAYHVDFQGHRTALAKPPHGQLDGVVRLADGTLLISSWEDSSVVGMKPGDAMYMIVQHGIESPADIGFDSKRRRLLVPVFFGNRIEIRPMTAGPAAHRQ
jgi:hypothetical protein